MILLILQKKKQIPLHSWSKDNKKNYKWIKKIDPDWIFVVGWSYLIRGDILKKYKNKIIGYHPSDLPNNRGRHPLIWSKFLNLYKLGSSFFIINKGIDDGRIISKRYFYNKKDLSMKNLYFKMIKTAQKQILDVVKFIFSNKKKNIKIKSKTGNVWRKRHYIDGQIDWRMSSQSIFNLVNALSWPYCNAHFTYKNKNFKIFKLKIIKNNIHNINLEPGKIIKIENLYYPCIKTYDGAIKLIDYKPRKKFKKGDYLD